MSEISYCVVTPGRTFDPIPSKSGRSDHLNEDLLTPVPVVKIKKGGRADCNRVIFILRVQDQKEGRRSFQVSRLTGTKARPQPPKANGSGSGWD